MTNKKMGKNIKKPVKGYYYNFKGKEKKYRGKFELASNPINNGLYMDNEGKLFIYKKPKEEESNLTFNKQELISDILNNKDKIKNSISEGEVLTDEDLKNIFVPEIQDSNDILIKIIKQKLIELKLPVKVLKSRFNTPMEFNNFKRALIIRDTITIQGFARWMEVLGIDWEITIKDNN